MVMSLEKTVLITGSSSGIGKACALELDRQGFRVFAGVRREEDGRHLQDQASQRLMPINLDVTSANEIASACESIKQFTGGAGLDGLINNAGYVFACPLEFIPIDRLRHQLEVNLIGQVALTQAMLPLLRQASGRIININSLYIYTTVIEY